ncbi:MAG: DUF952 domain-containing protein [Planctomycetota bacterium]
MIYKIIDRAAWSQAKQIGHFQGAAIDLKDGYIHFSTAEQVQETAAKHFANQHDLLLVAVDDLRLGETLKWERSRGNSLFPHLYSDLPLDAVVWEKELPWCDDEQQHQFPELE